MLAKRTNHQNTQLDEVYNRAEQTGYLSIHFYFENSEKNTKNDVQYTNCTLVVNELKKLQKWESLQYHLYRPFKAISASVFLNTQKDKILKHCFLFCSKNGHLGSYLLGHLKRSISYFF